MLVCLGYAFIYDTDLTQCCRLDGLRGGFFTQTKRRHNYYTTEYSMYKRKHGATTANYAHTNSKTTDGVPICINMGVCVNVLELVFVCVCVCCAFRHAEPHTSIRTSYEKHLWCASFAERPPHHRKWEVCRYVLELCLCVL